MVVPDFELICEIMLVAEGFLDARLLARKFITLYTLCRELLSKQVWIGHTHTRVHTQSITHNTHTQYLIFNLLYRIIMIGGCVLSSLY